MNEQERELDFMVAEITDAFKQERERTQRLSIEVQLLTEALRAKHEWVGLTDEEVDSLWEMAQILNPHKHFYLLMEAKLKEKNHGA